MKTTSDSVETRKQRLREVIWELLVAEGLAVPPFPVRGRIPNFVGSEQAANHLDEIKEYREASIVLIAPDYVLFHARVKTLSGGKSILLATPKLREGYLLLEHDKLKGLEKAASTISGSFRYGIRMKRAIGVDFVVEGCVAIDRSGNRLGKGGGYGDEEISVARTLNPSVKVAAICSSKQIVDAVPFTQADQPVDFIVTEIGVIRTR